MAEGNKVDGQEVSGVPDSVEYLSSVKISTYEEMKADNVAQSQKATLGWAEAVARDERAQHRHRDAAPSNRSRASSRAMYRASKDWQRTVQGVRRQMQDQFAPQSPSPLYAKGVIDTWWDKVMTRFFRWLGVK